MRPEEPISNVMTDAVVVIEVERPVSEALACFQQYPIHHLPVVRGGRLVGMLSSADLMKLEFFAPRGTTDRTQFLDSRFSIEQLMRAPVVSRGPRAGVAEVATAIIEAGVHAMPIVDEDERVLGLVSTTDLIRSLLHGPLRRGNGDLTHDSKVPPQDEAPEGRSYHRRPTSAEYAVAQQAAELMHVQARDPKFIGKTLLYLDQRRAYLEKVLERADRFLVAGQDEHNHAQLLKAVLAAKRAEEHAAGTTRVPFPLE
jgi:CBS domain-containing protein